MSRPGSLLQRCFFKARSFDQCIEPLSRDPPAVGHTEFDAGFVGSMKIAATGLEQAEFVSQLRILIDQFRGVIAVDHFQSDKTQIRAVLDNTLQLSVILRAKLHGMSRAGSPPER